MRNSVKALLLFVTAATLSLVVVLPAYGWQNGSAARGCGALTAQQWILEKANGLAVSSGADWLDMDVALSAVGEPDTRLHDFRHHTYDRWGARCGGDAPARIAAVYDELVDALVADDMRTASGLLGWLAHYYSDICSPLHTDNSKRERKHALHRRYELQVTWTLNHPSHSPTAAAAERAHVEDIAASLAAYSVATATEAHHDYRRLVRAFARHRLSHVAAASTVRSLDRAVTGVASIIVRAQRDRHKPKPAVVPTASPTPATTASPTPTAAPTASPDPTPSPTATPGPTQTPSASPTPSISPTPTHAPTPTPTPTPTATGGVVTVSGTNASAIDTAVSAARARGAGTTVVFPAGTYSHATLTWPDNIDLRGAGAGKTVLNFGVRFGSGSLIGDGTEAGGATIGATSTFYLLSGAHGTTFRHIRFRGVWNLCDYSGSWGAPVFLSNANAHDIVYSSCEFENASTSEIFNMWWDTRAGGGNLYNFTWDHCTFGVKNSAGVANTGRCAILLQPSPAEYGTNGPRTSGGGANFAFDWSAVTHGAGKAAVGGSGGYGFRLTNCDAVGKLADFTGSGSYYSFDICDYIRAWAMVTYRLSDAGQVTQTMRDAAPTAMAVDSFLVQNTWCSGRFVNEIVRNEVESNVYEGAKGSYDQTYHVSSEVLQHDRELYGL